MTLLLTGKILLYFVTTVVILWASRTAFRDWTSHGIFRLFAWEIILVLFLINMDFWFIRPFTLHQIASWGFLLLSLFWIIYGVFSLRRGNPGEKREDPSLLGIEKTTELITDGAYRYIRHPFYGSLLFLAWGIFFKRPGAIPGILGAAASFSLWMTARREERENLRYFGLAYTDYMKRTKMFIPYLF